MKLLLTALMAGALLAPAADAAIKHRQKHQGKRITQGVRSGELTRREATGLRRGWHRLNRSIRHDRIDGGGLTGRERVKIHHQQDRLSRQIYKQKHDGQSR